MKPATRAAVRFTLYGRGWCHLCDDMRDALAGFIAERGNMIDASVDYVDIDADPALVARYDEDVPVLLLDGVQICRHRFDAAQAQAALARCTRGAGRA